MARNVELFPARRPTGWRKISLGSWRPTGDSSIHAELEVNLERFYDRRVAGITLNHFVAKAVAMALVENPSFNAVIRWGRIHHRRHVDVFFHVLTDTREGENLSGVKLERVDQKSLAMIAAEFAQSVAGVHASGDAAFAGSKSIYRRVPGWLARFALDLASFFLYTLNIAAPCLLPRDAFSGIMISNLGTFGIERAFVPFAPYTRVSLVVAMGRAAERPVVDAGAVRVARTMRLGFTCDHRLVDGFHIGRLLASIRGCFEEPERLFPTEEEP